MELKSNSNFELACSFLDEIEKDGEEVESPCAETEDTTKMSEENPKKNKIHQIVEDQRKIIDNIQLEKQDMEREARQLLENVSQERAQWAEAKKAFQKEIVSLKAKLDGLENSVAITKAAAKEESRKYSSKMDECENLRTDLNNGKKRIEILEMENMSLKVPGLTDTLKNQLDEKIKDLATLNSFCETLEGEKVVWAKDKKAFQENIVALKNNIDGYKKQHSDITMSLAAKSEELKAAYQVNKSLKLQLSQGCKCVMGQPKNGSLESEVSEGEGSDQIDPGKVCLFELKEKNLCRRKGKCKFIHDFPDKLRTNEPFLKNAIAVHSERMGFCAVELVSKGECSPETCPFNHNKDESKMNVARKLKRTTPKEPIEQQGNYDKICYRELREEGSCPHGNQCHFEHAFPEELRNNEEFMDRVLEQQEKKTTKCYNEFKLKGSCQKGRACRHNHNISDELRKDPQMQAKMNKIYETMVGRSKQTTKKSPDQKFYGGNKNSHQKQLLASVITQLNSLQSIVTKLQSP
jgi:hypothetical protein